jgi:hypothetical protein
MSRPIPAGLLLSGLVLVAIVLPASPGRATISVSVPPNASVQIPYDLFVPAGHSFVRFAVLGKPTLAAGDLVSRQSSLAEFFDPEPSGFVIGPNGTTTVNRIFSGESFNYYNGFRLQGPHAGGVAQPAPGTGSLAGVVLRFPIKWSNTTGFDTLDDAIEITIADAPSVSSIVILDPNPTAAPTLHWRVTFSAPISGLTTGNFDLDASAVNFPTLEVTSVASETGTTPSDRWLVAGNIGATGTGLVALRMRNGSGTSPAVGGVPFEGLQGTYSIPEFPVITTQSPDVTILGGDTTTMTVTATSRGGTGHGPIQYQWFAGSPQSNPPIAGASASSYTPPAPLCTTAFFVRAFNDFPGVDFRVGINVTVTPVPTSTSPAPNVLLTYGDAPQSVPVSAHVTSQHLMDVGLALPGDLAFSLSSGSTAIGVPVSCALTPAGAGSGACGTALVIPGTTPAGTYAIGVVYAGPCYVAGSAIAGTLTIQPAATVTAAGNADVTVSAASQQVVLTAHVASPSGTVNEGSVTFTVKNGTTPLGPPVVATVAADAAAATLTLPGGTPPGSYRIEADFGGGLNFLPSSDNGAILTVLEPGGTTTTTITSVSTTTTTSTTVTTTTTSSSTTTTHAQTTTTTLPAGDCGNEPAAATFASIDCRLDALLADLDAEPGLGTFGPNLVKNVQTAKARKLDAEGFCRASNAKKVEKQLQQSAKALTQYAHRLNGLSARKKIASLRHRFLDEAAPIQSDLKTLRGSVRCPDDAPAG